MSITKTMWKIELGLIVMSISGDKSNGDAFLAQSNPEYYDQKITPKERICAFSFAFIGAFIFTITTPFTAMFDFSKFTYDSCVSCKSVIKNL